jgi:hypothetical protein
LNEKRVIVLTFASVPWERVAMIALLAASAIYLTGLQAVINAPTTAFKDCLKSASSKAASDKVGADGFDAYARTACTAQLGALKSALVGFDVKNGMSHKAASEDAESTISDYVGTSADHYKYMAEVNAPPKAASPAAPQALPQPAAQAIQASVHKPPQK